MVKSPPTSRFPFGRQFDSETAKQTALQAVAKWNQKTSEDFLVSEPQLWIFDESLLRPSIRPAELVWRMEVTPKDIGMPIRELVLINAQRGGISLYFNQIDTAWSGSKQADDAPTSTPEPLQPTEPSDEVIVPTPLNDVLRPNADVSTLEASDLQSANLGNTWYVATTGSDANSCSTPVAPCATINGAIGKAGSADTIEVAVGTYTGTGSRVVTIGATLRLSGGWNPGFTTQTGVSVIDGQNSRQGVLTYGDNTIIVTMERFAVVNGYVGSGGEGGGILNNGNTLNLNNITLSNNIAYYGYGGGINNRGTLNLNNVTLSNNSAGFGGGIYNSSSDTLTLNNTLVGGNSASGNVIASGPDCFGTINTSYYSLIGDTTDCQVVSGQGNLLNVNPRLGAFDSIGGYYPLMLGSQAIDAGNPATPGSAGNACLGTDQRGVARPVGTRCDIGAYEGSVPWTPMAYVNTYTAENYFLLPGVFLCNQTDPNCASGDSHAKSAHTYAIGTYNFYLNKFSRDSIDNAGMIIKSTVHYCDEKQNSPICPYDNAYWNGSQILYGDAHGYPLADDVVAHELTHGVTQYESNLTYLYQSGAINESLSDVFGEYYDQTNGLGNDTANVKWQMGEDVSGQGALRNMSNPPAYGDPDKMSSPNYYEGEDDNGGVHFNSGVNNKAVYLMVDGGTFNGKTVSPLGWDKTAAIYYEANTNLLSSGADYFDLYYALQQACTNLIGQKGITAGDCTEVKDAVDAVEMNGQPAPNFNTDAAYCDSGNPVTTILSDDLESGTGNWTFSNGAYPRWQYDSPYGPYAQSGLHSLYADDYPAVATDASARLKSFLLQSNTYLRFAQAYDFETGYLIGDPTFYNFDGGVLEYSTNNGGTWVDAGSLIDVNGYKGTVATGGDNPLSGRSAFVGTSHGYISTRLNLSALVGQTVSFRWRMGLDEIGYSGGWWIDTVQAYTCPTAPSKDTTGVFRPISGLLYLKNSNDTGFADAALNYGLPGDYPVVGDWDGNGTVTIGIYRSGSFYLKNANTLGFAEIVFPFGQPGDQPIAGDWDGDGVDTIGVFHPSNGHFLLRNSNTEGPSDMDFYLGNPGDVGVAGDWNEDGMDTTGVFRPSNGVIFLKDTNDTGFADYALNYGLPGDRPVMGDWDNDGKDTIGIYRNGSFYLRNSNTNGFAELIFGLGNPGDMPIAGNWDGLP